jgi:hypothetical protein
VRICDKKEKNFELKLFFCDQNILEGEFYEINKKCPNAIITIDINFNFHGLNPQSDMTFAKALKVLYAKDL